MIKNRLPTISFGLIGIVLAATTGCHLQPRIPLADDGSLAYRSAHLEYRLSRTDCLLPLDSGVPTKEIDLAEFSDESLAAAERETWSVAHLAILYPHPDGHPEQARAILKLAREPLPEAAIPGSWIGRAGQVARNSYERIRGRAGLEFEREIQVDVPRARLDELLTELGSTGYFEEQTRPNGGTTLSAKIGWTSIEKPWTAEPAFDKFIAHVYRAANVAIGESDAAVRTASASSESDVDMDLARDIHVVTPDQSMPQSGYLRRLRR